MNTVLADGEGHGPERADRSGLHDDADDGKQRVAGLIDDAKHDLSALTDHLQAKRKQDCEEKHLQDLALSECAHHRVGDDVHQKLDRALLLGLRYEPLDSSGVDRAGVDIHGGAGLQRIGDNEPHDEGERRQHLEIDEGLQADAANPLHILHAGNAVHDRTEDDRRDDHLDRLDEGVPQGLHLLAQLWIEMTEQHAEHDRGQHLEIEALKERPVVGGQFSCGGLGCHRRLSPSVSSEPSLFWRRDFTRLFRWRTRTAVLPRCILFPLEKG